MSDQGAQKYAGFRWTGRRERAARLVAEDELTNEQIAATLGVSRRALDKWKAHPDFRERVNSLVADIRAAILQEGIAVKANRIKALNERDKALNQILVERGQDPALQEIPGGKTGRIVRTAKLVKVYNADGEPDSDEEGETLYSAKRDVMVYEYQADLSIDKELREIAKQAAVEMGQWTEKQTLEHTGKVQYEHGLDDDAAKHVADLIAAGILASAQTSSGD